MFLSRGRSQDGHDLPLASLAEIESNSRALEAEGAAMGDVFKQEALETTKQVRAGGVHSCVREC